LLKKEARKIPEPPPNARFGLISHYFEKIIFVYTAGIRNPSEDQ
jgi:hypothetical protein